MYDAQLKRFLRSIVQCHKVCQNIHGPNDVARTINNLTHLQRGVPGPDVMTTCADQPNRCRNGDNSAQGAAATRGDLNRRSMLGCLQRLQQLSSVVFLLLDLGVVHVAIDTPTPQTDTTLERFAGSRIILCDDNLRGFICFPGASSNVRIWSRPSVDG